MKLKEAQRRIARALVAVLALGFIQTGLSSTPAVAAAPIEPTISSITSRPTSLLVNMVTTGIDATSWRWSVTRGSGVSCANPLGDGVVQSTSSLVSSFSISNLTAGCIYSVKVAGFNGVIGEYTDSEELVGAFTNGLTVYYANDPDSGTAMIRRPISASTTGYCGWETVTQISQNWTTAAPAPTNPSGTCNADNFTAYYVGYIKAPTTGNVTFKSRSDDNFYLNIQGANIIADNLAHGPAGPGLFDAQATIYMTAGEVYRIEAWMHEIQTGAAAYLDWQYGAVGQQTIPSEWLATDPSVFYGGCPIGLAARCAAGSALEIKQATGMNMNGQYWIMVNGIPTLTYCIMDSAMSGGGWMMAMKGRKSSSGFGYSSAFWTNTATTGEIYPERWQENNSNRDIDAKYGVFAYNKGNQIMALFPEQTTYAGGATNALNSTYGFSWIETTTAGRTWTSADGDSWNVNLSGSGGPNGSSCVTTATTLTNLFANSHRCAFRKVSSTYSTNETPYSAIGNGLFYSQADIRFFGINYGSSAAGNMALARWGFGWNENGATSEGSNDGSGGIGLAYSTYAVQTGSINNCCATQNGISGTNPSSRNIPFEMYIRNTITASVSAVNMRVSTKRTSSQNSGSTVSASGTNGSNTFRLSPLMDGVTIDSSTGVISVSDGVPVGSYTQTVSVIDSNGVSGSKTITIQVVSDSFETDTALNFTGVNTLLTANTIPVLTGNQTWEAWVRPGSECSSASQKTVFGSDNFVLLCINGYWYVSFRTNSGWNSFQTSQNINYNSWTHVAIVRNGNTVSMYINEAQTRFWTNSWVDSWDVAGLYSADSYYYIGGYGAGQYYIGQIDEVKIWNEARTLSQIITGMYVAPDLSSTNLNAYWDFNEGSGTSAVSRAPRSDTRYNLSPLSTQWSSIATTTTSGPYTVISIPRTLISKTPGWRVPDSVTAATVLLVGGGGGGAGSYTTRIQDAAGAGGAGGVYYAKSVPLDPKSYVSIKVGAAGAGGVPTTTQANTRGYTGTTTTFDALSAGGGGGGGYVDATNQDGLSGTAGGAGGGASNFWEAYKAGDAGTSSSVTVNGKLFPASATAGAGASWNGTAGHTGGGAGGAATPTTRGPGVASAITGETVTYGVGGGAYGISSWSFNQTTSFGNGGDANYYNSTGGGQGGSGLIIIRYITKLKPTFTSPTNTTINLGMAETFTTNVPQDSFTAGLTRTFRWESTTGGVAGTFSFIKSETGVSGASFSWIPPDTTTSGSNYRYRVIVTDSDSDGLFIVETSTSAFAMINGTLRLVGKSSLSKTVNLSKNETFTVTGGTSTFRYSLTPDGPNFSLDTSTVGTPVIRFIDTVTVGTYYETITVSDSISASFSIPLTIKVSPPPSFSANSEQVDSGTVMYLDAGNTSSYPRTGTTWRDISGLARNADMNAATPSSRFLGTTSTSCIAPSFSPENLGVLNFTSAQKQCAVTPALGLYPNYTLQVWIKRNGTPVDWTAIVSNPWSGNGQQLNFSVFWYGSKLTAGVFDGTNWNYAHGTDFANALAVPDLTWVLATVTFNGSTIKLSIDRDGATQTSISAAASISWSLANLDSTLAIGRRWDSNDFFNGSIASLRIYNRVLTSSEISQNFNATKGRFANTQNKQAQSGKYGTKYSDTFTVTAGSETITAAWSNSSLTRIKWDTSTARTLVLSTQESLTPGIYYDTITVSDVYGASTQIPLTYTIAKADTLTVWIETPTAVNYTGTNAIFSTALRVTGLVSSDTGTTVSSIKYRPGGTSCATGGVCSVGDIGPGGGIVFITPSTAGGNGKYFEAAPFTWAGSDELGSAATYCSNHNLNLGATNVGIGWGETNTNLAKSACLGGAVGKVNTFNLANNTGYSDWFIPSTNEMIELAKVRIPAGLLLLGNNWAVGRYGYWTSTEGSASVQSSLVTSSWSIGGTNKSDASNNLVRPVRAFIPCWAVNGCLSLAATSKPINAGTYAINAETLTLTTGDLANYASIRYETTTVTINRINQTVEAGAIFNAAYPDVFTLFSLSGSGTGAAGYSIVSGGTASGCTADYKKFVSSSVGTCNVQIVRQGDRNFLADTSTVYLYFMTFVINQPAPAVGTGPNIALSGQTSVQLEATVAPTISGISSDSGAVGSTITITGAGFYFADPSKLSIKFWRNVAAVTYTIVNDTTVTVTVPASATTGRIVVTTPNGQAASSTFTVTS